MRLFIVVCLVVLLIVGVSWSIAGSRKNAPTQVTMATVERGDFTKEVSGTGAVEAKVYSLSFSQPGRVAHVGVVEGDEVTAGTVLAELDIAKIREDLGAARTALTTLNQKTRTEQQRLTGERDTARRKLRLTCDLLAVGGAAQNEVTDLERQVADLQGQLDVLLADAQRQRSDLQAQIQGFEQALRESRLTAPVAGTVATVDFRTGETAQGALKLIERGTLRVKAQMGELDAIGIQTGQVGRVELDALPDHPLRAVVDEVGVQATAKNEGASATLAVKFRFLDDEARTLVKSGYSGTARVVTQQLSGVLMIPLEALVEEKEHNDKKYYVWAVVPAAQPRQPATVTKTPVTVKARNLMKAAVEGLTEGAQVVSLPPDSLQEGAKIRSATGEKAGQK